MDHDELAAELLRRYPEQVMPLGAGLQLARELDVSIAAVAAARRSAGVSVEPATRNQYVWSKKRVVLQPVPPPTTRQRLTSILHERYPCKRAPTGTWGRL